jgi:hypothetical protein
MCWYDFIRLHASTYMKKVVFVTNTFLIGGFETCVISGICRGINEKFAFWDVT